MVNFLHRTPHAPREAAPAEPHAERDEYNRSEPHAEREEYNRNEPHAEREEYNRNEWPSF